MSVFDRHADKYDRWFDVHKKLFLAEVQTLKEFVPTDGMGLEIGVGTGRFSLSLGIRFGIDPSPAMARFARFRGVNVALALGECLPFRENQFDFILLVTVICFARDVLQLLIEARRTLKKGGRLVLGFIDRDSALGRHYRSRKAGSLFFRPLRLHSLAEVTSVLEDASFTCISPAVAVPESDGFVVMSATR